MNRHLSVRVCAQSGYVFTYNSAAISWSSKKQDTIALSSCEAEIVAASEAAKEGIYLANFLEELDLALAEPLELGTDNTGARESGARITSADQAH